MRLEILNVNHKENQMVMFAEMIILFTTECDVPNLKSNISILK